MVMIVLFEIFENWKLKTENWKLIFEILRIEDFLNFGEQLDMMISNAVRKQG